MKKPNQDETPVLLMVAAPARMGYVALAVEDAAVAGISFGHRTEAQAIKRLAQILDAPWMKPSQLPANSDCRRFAADVLDRLVRFLEGEPVSFDDVPVSLDHLSPFQRRVAAACRAIPYGATRTYGQLAAVAGSAGAARAVGQVMATNRAPLIVPCHRVIGAGGKLGGFSAPRGITTKQQLLEMEGVDRLPPSKPTAKRPSSRRPQRVLTFS